MGKFGGKLKSFDVRKLGALVISGALKGAGIDGSEVDEVLVGHCRQAGNCPNPAKISSMWGGIPQDVPAVYYKQCLSFWNESGYSGRSEYPFGRNHYGYDCWYGEYENHSLSSEEG